MAKREVEEINAGSMADIAFLLLIFFLITTTMNLPQVHEERLPQKSDVEFLLNERNVLQIMANKNDKLAWEVNELKPYWFTLWLKPIRKISQFIRI